MKVDVHFNWVDDEWPRDVAQAIFEAQNKKRDL